MWGHSSNVACPEAPEASLGALVQMEAQGMQNYYLNVDPEVTFWTTKHKHHSNFAIETFESDFDDFGFDALNASFVPNRGHMLGDMFLELRLPRLKVDGTWTYDSAITSPSSGTTWVSQVGYNILRRIRLVLNDVEIHDQDRFFYVCSDACFTPAERQRGLDAMIGTVPLSTDRVHILYVPLKFFFCKQHFDKRQFFPMLGPTDTQLTLEIQTAPLSQCVIPPSWTYSEAGATPSGIVDLDPGLRCKLLYDVVFLTQSEAAQLLETPHRLMVQLSKNITESAHVPNGETRQRKPEIRIPLNCLTNFVDLLVFGAYDEASTNSNIQFLDAIDSAQLVLSPQVALEPRTMDMYSKTNSYANSLRCAASSRLGMHSFKLDCSVRVPNGSLNFSGLQQSFLRMKLKPQNASTNELTAIAVVFYTNVLTVFKGKASYKYA